MHLSSNLIRFLYITDKTTDIPKYMKSMFNINVSNEEIQALTLNLRKIKNNKYNSKMLHIYLSKFNIQQFEDEVYYSILEKFSRDKSKLYFLNTCIFRGIDPAYTYKLMNANFTTIEEKLFYTCDDISIYRDSVFNLDIAKQEDIEKFYASNKSLFCVDSAVPIERIQTKAGLLASREAKVVLELIKDKTIDMFLADVDSANSDTRRGSLEYAKISAKVSVDILKLKAVDSQSAIIGDYLKYQFKDGDGVKINHKDSLDYSPIQPAQSDDYEELF